MLIKSLNESTLNSKFPTIREALLKLATQRICLLFSFVIQVCG
ncbi:unnamed protein product [Acanthoscelides obtectus]|uniref:Uncharacterized protein n=1 Tax=Acanthoscelides obtectus TaxID=200917 RepID=A0A9P0L5H1_ACAOB|nr:unnamed protein product [Acanthoscelides obtectus]CAK1624626.1 hypothetical protein AOBTE_LOCUS2658 [Acanthoscelides obtectus]